MGRGGYVTGEDGMVMEEGGRKKEDANFSG